jgi:DNA-directed RNA polymerase specialized sigma24 family protein
MHGSNQVNPQAADLHWLAFLLTGDHESSIEIISESADSLDDSNAFFSTWMLSWSRRLIIAKALAKVRDQLTASARRTESVRMAKRTLAPRGWELSPNSSRSELQEALLAIDLFPRAALVLSIFEGMSVEDAAVLLGVNLDLVKKGRAFAARELTANLARITAPARRRNVSICRFGGTKSLDSTYRLTHFVPVKL